VRRREKQEEEREENERTKKKKKIKLNQFRCDHIQMDCRFAMLTLSFSLANTKPKGGPNIPLKSTEKTVSFLHCETKNKINTKKEKKEALASRQNKLRPKKAHRRT
jgi:hypothetical protein